MKSRSAIPAAVKRSVALALLLVFGLVLAAQTGNPADLRQRRQQLLRDLQRNQQRLDRTRAEKQETLEQLALLGSQIRKREQLIQHLRTEVTELEQVIALHEDSVRLMQHHIDVLKSEYVRTLRVAYRALLTRSWAAFLFSSTDINQAFRRWQYLRQYQRYRHRQSRAIEAVQKSLRSQITSLEAQKREKESLLGINQQQRGLLDHERNDQTQLLGKLKTSESRIASEISTQQKAHEALNTAIETAIAEEVARQRRATAAAASTSSSNRSSGGNTAKPSASTSAPAAENNPISQSFAAQRGRLAWPVSQGQIVRRFGRQPHPSVPNIEISNNGIDISTTAHAPVSSVHSGEVVSLRFVPGYQHTVLVKHGDYYTVYSNLESVSVSKGQKLNAGDRIGAASGGENGNLHFELWRQEQRQNPEHWISRR